MGNPLVPLLLSAFLTIQAASAAASSHKISLKSALTARRECVQYRDARNLTLIASPQRSDQESTCVCRCELIKLGLWPSDSVGQLEVPSHQYYTPNADDQCYRERTRKCVQDRLAHVAPTDGCSKAFAFYKCYNDQYGTVHLDRIGYIPHSQLQHEQVLRDCVQMLDVSKEEVQSLIDSQLMTSGPKSGCLLRCFLVREGLYTDQEGPLTRRLFTQFATENHWDQFREQFEQCYSIVKKGTCDSCFLAKRLVLDCLDEDSSALKSILAALKNIASG